MVFQVVEMLADEVDCISAVSPFVP